MFHAAAGVYLNSESMFRDHALKEKKAAIKAMEDFKKDRPTFLQLQLRAVNIIKKKGEPSIAREKKWSQVQGILTGPLGTLIQTMNSLCKDTDSSEAKKAAAKVKSDIIVVSQEATRKNEAGVGGSYPSSECVIQRPKAQLAGRQLFLLQLNGPRRCIVSGSSPPGGGRRGR